MEPDAERERQDVNVPLIKEPKMSAHFDTTVWKGLKGGKRVITGPPSRSPIRSPTRIEADVQVCAPARVGVSVAVIKGHALRPSPHVSTRMKNFLPFRLFPTPLGLNPPALTQSPSRTGYTSARIHRVRRAQRCDRTFECCDCEQEYIAARCPHDWQYPAGENTCRSLCLCCQPNQTIRSCKSLAQGY